MLSFTALQTASLLQSYSSWSGCNEDCLFLLRRLGFTESALVDLTFSNVEERRILLKVDLVPF